jgi:hypothetical protein
VSVAPRTGGPIARGHRRAWLLPALLLPLAACAAAPTAAPSTRVSIEGDRWLIDGRPVNAGSAAHGRLMNVRMVNAVFEDEGESGRARLGAFDPDENTDRFIARIPEYVASGVNAFTVSLQGGMPGYEGAVNSAFNADGSLRETYLARVARVIEAADRHGAVVILSCLYQRQQAHARALDGRAAVRRGVAEVAGWVRRSGFTNVVLEVANEYSHSGYRGWPDGEWLRSAEGQAELIAVAREAAPDLLVSTSGMGDGSVAAPVARAADFILIHLNTTPLDRIASTVELARAWGKPVVVNEDDKVGMEGARAAALAVESGAGWGFMHVEQNQMAPFSFDGVADDPVVYAAFRRLTARGAAGAPPSPAFAP